ncbi:unnamed protein product [Ixodes persulcatus]
MKQQMFILLAALQLSYQEHQSQFPHKPDEVIGEYYQRLSPGCKTELQLQMEQVCKVHNRPNRTTSPPRIFFCNLFEFCSRCLNIYIQGGSRKICQNFRICKNGLCVNSPNFCEIDYFFP